MGSLLASLVGAPSAPAVADRASGWRTQPTATRALRYCSSWGSSAWAHTPANRVAAKARTCSASRYRLGNAEPTNLVELVRQPQTLPQALAAAKALLEGTAFVVAVCGDFPGRIVDRLIRPYFNAALRRLDEGLASAEDMDTTLRLGLGYPEGPISLLERTGLAHHFDVTQPLYEQFGDAAYAPARRARVAKLRVRE